MTLFRKGDSIEAFNYQSGVAAIEKQCVVETGEYSFQGEYVDVQGVPKDYFQHKLHALVDWELFTLADLHAQG